jgi:hypothetical protein
MELSFRFPENLDMRFTAAVSHEQPWYVARCLEVEVTSQGESSMRRLPTRVWHWSCISRISRFLMESSLRSSPPSISWA